MHQKISAHADGTLYVELSFAKSYSTPELVKVPLKTFDQGKVICQLGIQTSSKMEF
jgi:hypothetical protein